MKICNGCPFIIECWEEYSTWCNRDVTPVVLANKSIEEQSNESKV